MRLQKGPLHQPATCLRNGTEASEFILRTGVYTHRQVENSRSKVDSLEVLW
jgi:hypothetical protein